MMNNSPPLTESSPSVPPPKRPRTLEEDPDFVANLLAEIETLKSRVNFLEKEVASLRAPSAPPAPSSLVQGRNGLQGSDNLQPFRGLDASRWDEASSLVQVEVEAGDERPVFQGDHALLERLFGRSVFHRQAQG